MKAPKLVSGPVSHSGSPLSGGFRKGVTTRISDRRSGKRSEEIVELIKYDSENRLMEGLWVRRWPTP